MATLNVNGIDLFYQESGSGTPILLIHGAAGNADVWSSVFGPLAHGHRVIAYDRRAHTRSKGVTAEQLQCITQSVTCVLGELTMPVFVEANDRAIKLLSRAQVVRIPDASHAVHIDQPDRFVEAVKSAALRTGDLQKTR